MSELKHSRLDRLLLPGVVIALIGAVLLAVGFNEGPTAVFQAYLFGWWVAASIVFGCFGLTLLHHSLRNRWSLPILRIWESGGGWRSLGLLFLLLVPLMVGSGYLFDWSDPMLRQTDPALIQRGVWMAPATVYVRAAVIFAIFMAMAFLNETWTRKQEATGRQAWLDRRASLSAAGLLIFVLLMTLLTTDWAMALDSHWFSTVYAPLVMMGQALSGLAIAIIVIATQHRRTPYASVINPQLTRDLGNLTLTFVILWTYLTLAQYLIIWSGNLPEYITYYVDRVHFGWEFIGAILLILQFFIPMLLLFSPEIKRNVSKFVWVGVLILAVRPLDIYYMLVPSMRDGGPEPLFLLPLTGAALLLVGVWLAAFALNIRSAPLLPVARTDPDDDHDYKEATEGV